jgi:dipeptidase E
MTNLLLLSNSTMPGTSFFAWPKPWVKDFLTSAVKEVLFLPFAAVTFPFDEYEEKVKEAFGNMNYRVRSLHRVEDKKTAVKEAEAIMIGGGNTFALLSRVCEYGLLDIIRTKVHSGTPYIGWSAGANLAGPTIMTTNDMPVVQPPSFEALKLVPFQLNPHYHELKFETQGGETRKERLEEFIALNRNCKVIGLPEGMLLHRKENTLFLRGDADRVAKLYEAGKKTESLVTDTDLSWMLGTGC